MLTNSELNQIKNFLALYGKKDSQLSLVTTVKNADYVTIVQENENVRITVDLLKKAILEGLVDESEFNYLVDDYPTEGSNNLIRSKGVYNALTSDDIIGTPQIKYGSVTTDKVADENITKEKLSNDVKTVLDAYDDVRVLAEESEQVLKDTKELLNTYQPIVIEGNVVNAPDEEDLTFENNLLKLKNRGTLNSKYGYVTLRRNKSFSEQVILSNTVYEIRYNFNLSENTVEIPDNCILKFDGGSLSNGTLSGNNTKIEYKGTIFNNITIIGTWNVPEIYSWMFEDIHNNKLRQLFALQNDNIKNTIFIEKTTEPYTIGFVNEGSLEEQLNALLCTKNTEVVINGYVKLDDNIDTRPEYSNVKIYRILRANTNCFIHGNGTLEGDRLLYETPETEYGAGIYVEECNNVTIEGLTLKNFQGDCISEGGDADNLILNNLELIGWYRNGISICSGNATISNINAHDGGFYDPWSIIDIEPITSEYVENINISNIKGQNIGCGLCIGCEALGHIKNVTIKDVYLDGIKGYLIGSAGYGGECLTISNFNANNIKYGSEALVSNFRNGQGHFINTSFIRTEITNLIANGDAASGTGYACVIARYLGSVNLVNSTITAYKILDFGVTADINIENCNFTGNNLIKKDYDAYENKHLSIKNSTINAHVALYKQYCNFVNNIVYGKNNLESDDKVGMKVETKTSSRNKILIENNVIFSGDSVNTLVRGLDVITGKDIKIINNTVSSRTGYLINCGIYIGTQASGNIYYENNTFSGTFSAGKYANNNQPIFQNKSHYRNIGTTAQMQALSITTSQEPNNMGFMFFNTSINKPCWWQGSKWILADGSDAPTS